MYLPIGVTSFMQNIFSGYIETPVALNFCNIIHLIRNYMYRLKVLCLCSFSTLHLMSWWDLAYQQMFQNVYVYIQFVTLTQLKIHQWGGEEGIFSAYWGISNQRCSRGLPVNKYKSSLSGAALGAGQEVGITRDNASPGKPSSFPDSVHPLDI